MKDTEDSKTSKETTKTPRSNNFTWKEGNTFERICFVISNISLIASVVFLFLERTQEYEAWPYAGFDISIAITFIAEAMTNFRLKRAFAITILIFGLAFLTFGVLRLFGIKII